MPGPIHNTSPYGMDDYRIVALFKLPKHMGFDFNTTFCNIFFQK